MFGAFFILTAEAVGELPRRSTGGRQGRHPIAAGTPRPGQRGSFGERSRLQRLEPLGRGQKQNKYHGGISFSRNYLCPKNPAPARGLIPCTLSTDCYTSNKV